jgi:hypothetical protein
LLPNHHVWSWYIQWMILDGFISSIKIKIRRKNLQWYNIFLWCNEFGDEVTSNSVVDFTLEHTQ